MAGSHRTTSNEQLGTKGVSTRVRSFHDPSTNLRPYPILLPHPILLYAISRTLLP